MAAVSTRRMLAPSDTLLPTSCDGGIDFGVGEAAFGTDGELGGLGRC